jgi:hypothetical protein
MSRVIDYAGRRRDRLRDLVDVAGGGQSGADVEELPNARLTGQVADRAAGISARHRDFLEHQ